MSRRDAWPFRPRPEGTCAACGRPVWGKGVRDQGKLYHAPPTACSRSVRSERLGRGGHPMAFDSREARRDWPRL